jgi:hypothetical protein
MDITISTGTYGRLRIRSIRNFGRVRFSLRTLLIGMRLVGLVLGVIVTVMKWRPLGVKSDGGSE